SIPDGTANLDPTEYEFLLHFDYSAQVILNQILSGRLDARVKVEFRPAGLFGGLAYAKQWSRPIVDFGNGFSLPPLNLIQGSSGEVPSGFLSWATVQMPTPWVPLRRLDPPAD